MSRSRKEEIDRHVESLKRQAQHELDAGKKEVVLDVKGLALRDRQRIRSFAGRWFTRNGWIGHVNFDQDLWTITLRVEERRVRTTECVHPVVQRAGDEWHHCRMCGTNFRLVPYDDPPG